MVRIYEGIAHHHQHGVLMFAVLSCVVGSTIFVLLTRRMTVSGQRQQVMQLALASIIGGATIWSTHFLAMLAYDPGVRHVYDPVLTLASLAIAALGLVLSNVALAYWHGPFRVIAAGSLFGITVSTMHYTGMSAVILPGELIWELERVTASLVAGVVLGIVSYHRILHPYTRFCRAGAIFGIILTICAMHFTGMSAFTIELDSSIPVPAKQISDFHFAVFVTSVSAVLYLVGFFSFGIETENIGKLRQAALHDPLTGLANRLKLRTVLSKLANTLETDRTARVAVLSIDLDNFKHANDMYGHAAGDQILEVVAQRLRFALTKAEFVARTGGDEFVVVKWDFRRVEQVVSLAKRLHAQIIEPIAVGEGSVLIGSSIGIATSIHDGNDVEELLKKSDLAMYHAKSQPDCQVVLFDEELAQASREKTTMIADLKEALQHDQFELHYQMQNAMQTLSPTGFEVLIRWRHPTKGLVRPDLFIPLAEETGLIRPIGQWVLETACKEAASWSSPYSIAVNVAPQQLVQPSFVEQVAMTLDKTGLAPERLELEITEAGMIDDPENTLRVMTELKSMGVRIAMDDFGTGYSSLATLQAFPFDKIKIDRSFVSEVHSSNHRAAIVRSTILLGKAFQIPVLAEGVEDAEELEFLRSEDCDAVQGFYFGRPMTLQQLHEMVAAHGKEDSSRAS